jgi:hypothetical protein
MRAAARCLDHLAGRGWFWAWAAGGFGTALGFVSLVFLAWVPTLCIAVQLASSPRARRSALGVLAGIGLLCLLVAWIHRDGPLDPLPWLTIGVAFALSGLVAHAVYSRRDG